MVEKYFEEDEIRLLISRTSLFILRYSREYKNFRGMVLEGHLLIENTLERAIGLSIPEWTPGHNLKFYEIVNIYSNVHNISSSLKGNLKNINKIRNNVSHEYDLKAEDVLEKVQEFDNLGGEFNPTKIFYNNNNPYHSILTQFFEIERVIIKNHTDKDDTEFSKLFTSVMKEELEKWNDRRRQKDL